MWKKIKEWISNIAEDLLDNAGDLLEAIGDIYIDFD